MEYVLNDNTNHINALVSVIIPAYNAEKWIERSINSVLKQSYDNIEAIVVENGSVDSTSETVLRIEDDRVKLFHSEKGVSNARNLGIEKASGEYIFFLDADDWLVEDAIEKLIGFCSPEVDIVAARYYGDKPFEKYKSKDYSAQNKEFLLKCLYYPTKRGNVTGNLYKRDFINMHEIRFKSDLTHAEDSVFFLELLLKKPHVIDVEEHVYCVYHNCESATRKLNNDNEKEFVKSVKAVYELTLEQDEQVINGTYIFALNQVLVILVNSNKRIKDLYDYTLKLFDIDVFNVAIDNANLSVLNLSRKVVLRLAQKKMYRLFLMAILARTIRNKTKKKE